MASFTKTVQDIRYSLDDEPLDDTITQFIKDLSKPNGGCLIKWPQNENTKQYIEIKKKLVRIRQINNIKQIKSRYPYCWIIPANEINEVSKQQRISFEMDYKIVIHDKNELYYSIFTASYVQIQKLHQIALKTKIYFPSVPFTTVHQDVNIYFRSQELKDDLELEEKYMILPNKLQCKGPGKSYMVQIREATQIDYDNLSELLCKIFNSPSFAIQGWIYSVLNEDKNNNVIIKEYNIECNEEKKDDTLKYICSDLRLLLKHKAYKKLLEWRYYLKYQFRSYEKEPFKSVHKTLKKKQKTYNIIDDNDCLPKQIFNTMFHSVFVVSTIISALGDHWAVIFEGKYYLLTIEYFEDFINFKFVPNTIIGQRVCWYSQCASKNVSEEMFNKRWSTLRKSYLPKTKFNGQVTFNHITNLIKIWLSKSDYYRTTNNCQHFARNIFAALDPIEAKFLNIKFDQKNMFIVFPSMPVADVYKESINMLKFMEDIQQFDDIKNNNNDNDNDNGDIDQFEIIIKGLGKKMYIDTDDDDDDDDDINDFKQEQEEKEEEEEEEEKKQKQIDPKQLLLEFGIPDQYINKIIINMEKEKYNDPIDWIDLYNDENTLIEMGFPKLQCKKFERKYCLWMKQNN